MSPVKQKNFYKKKILPFILSKTPQVEYLGIKRLQNDGVGNDLILKNLLSGKVFFAGRLGYTECEACAWQHLLKKNYPLIRRYPSHIKNKLYLQAGMFSNSFFGRNTFCRYYFDAISNVDILFTQHSIPGEGMLLRKYLKKETDFFSLNVMKPFTFEKPWSLGLKNKKVLVIHPFEKSIKSQFEIKNEIWNSVNYEVLPEFTLITYKAFSTLPGQHKPLKTWKKCLLKMFDDISKIDFDIALVGCGSYGFPLANLIYKRLHRTAINIGGTVQILFGIKGKRWEGQFEACDYRKYFNEYWVRPLDEETPKCAGQIEDGCYW